ncbi:MAG: hypothetical protein ACOCYB_10335 [Alkalispirochaeta sp.]
MATSGKIPVSEKQKREYDLFGPWVLEIEAPEDVPETFSSHVSLTGDTEFAFKVPRRIERRNARPGDDLYDYLVTFDGAGVSVYCRTSAGVQTESAGYDRIVAVETLYDLLHGELALITDAETIRVPFNTVSEDVIHRGVEIIRTHLRGDSLPVPPSAVDPEDMIYLYRGLLHREQSYEAAAAVAYQAPRTVQKREPTVLDRLLDVVKRSTLRALLVIVSGHDIIVYRGEPPVTRFGRGNYGYSRTITPRPIEKISIQPEPVYAGCAQLRVGTGGTELSFLVDEHFNSDHVDSVLHAP